MASKLSFTDVRDFIIDCVVIIKQVFRDILKTQIQPEDLYSAIQSCGDDVHKGIYKVNPEQMKIYFPKPSDVPSDVPSVVPDYDEFDISFFFSLFWKLCRKGEKHLSEHTIDDIKKLINLKDKLYAILESTAQTTGDYLESRTHLSAELNSILEELKTNLQSGNLSLDYVHYEKKINKMEESYPFFEREEGKREVDVERKKRISEIGNVDKDKILEEFRKWTCDKHKGKKLHRLYFGTADSPKENIKKGGKVIVAVVDNTEGIDKKEPFSHNNIPIPIFWKGWKEDSKKMFLGMEEQQELQIQHIEKLKSIDKYLDENSEDLFEKHSNLEMLRASTFRVERGEAVKKPCIVFYFSCKGVVPFNETRIPNVLGGNETDVREGFFQSYCNLNEDVCADSKDLLNPLRMGASIGGKEGGEGSLGGFVEFKDGSEKEYGFITCAHNIYSPDEMESTELPSTPIQVRQPSLLREGSQICGETVKSVSSFINAKDNITVDATLVRLKERFSKEHILFAGLLDVRLEKYGFSRSTFPRFIDGVTLDLRKQEDRQLHLSQRYLKCGTATGLTVGFLNLICTRKRKDFTDDRHSQNDKKLYQLVYDEQLEIYGEDFAKAGDSGSLVFQVREDDASRLQCIGMIVGSNSNEHITAFTPINSVLEALALDVKLI